MDKLIEIMSVYWIDWQQTAIANTRYSVVLMGVAFLAGWFIVSMLKRGKVAALDEKLQQEQMLLSEANSKHEAFLNQQKNDLEKMSDIQQQLEQATVGFKKEKELFQSELASKDELFITAENEKKQTIDELNSELNKNTQLAEQLQNQLNEQKDNMAQYTALQVKVSEIEAYAKQSDDNLMAAKQELDNALNFKNEHLDELVKSHSDQVSELEQQLETINNSNEETQQQENDTKEQIFETSKHAVESVAESIVSVETTVINKPDEENNQKQGFVSRVMGIVTAFDKKFESENSLIEEVSEIDQPSIEQQHNQIPESVDVVAKIVADEEKSEIDEEERSSFSEKLSEVADSMDSYQEKLKGFFSKKKA